MQLKLLFTEEKCIELFQTLQSNSHPSLGYRTLIQFMHEENIRISETKMEVSMQKMLQAWKRVIDRFGIAPTS